jgi:hypothetical protein
VRLAERGQRSWPSRAPLRSVPTSLRPLAALPAHCRGANGLAYPATLLEVGTKGWPSPLELTFKGKGDVKKRRVALRTAR